MRNDHYYHVDDRGLQQGTLGRRKRAVMQRKDRRVRAGTEEPEDSGQLRRQPEAQLKLGQQQSDSRQKLFLMLLVSPRSAQPSILVNCVCVHLLHYVFP